MKKNCLLLLLAGAVLLCGCNKQAKINSEKIELLSRNIIQFEQGQTRQMAAIQSELTSLGPMLDKMNDFYFEKSHDEAFFFHTNTLYLLLTVDKNIESELHVADAAREAQNAEAHKYYTNVMDTLYLSNAQIAEAMAAQEKRIEDNVNAQTRQFAAALRDELLEQIKLSTSNADEIAQQKEMTADVAQIKRDLEQLKAQLGQLTNRAARF